jgi:cobyrinic acid a,c-diamide synthase
MYLSRSIAWNGERACMVGAIPGDAVMHARPVGRGYVHLQETTAFPWPGGGAEVRGHEFHHSSLENVDPAVGFGYRVTRGHGIDGRHDGIVHRNLLASYAHRQGGGANGWAPRFVAFVRQVADERGAARTGCEAAEACA